MKMEWSGKSRKRVSRTSNAGATRLSRSPRATYKMGQALGRQLNRGVVALIGELGAGKTVFAKGLADGLGVPNAQKDVVSPSFMIIREHQGRVPFYHMDLYRLNSKDEILQLNLGEYFEKEGVCLVEWADRALSILPDSRTEIFLEVVDFKKRRISIYNRIMQSL